MKIHKPALATLLTLCAAAQADVRLPSIFAEHMVLQRDKAAPVWGWAEPGEEVAVSFGGQSKSAKAGEDGKWSVTLDPMPASAEPRTLAVKGNNEVAVGDVLVGEVWVCSGQSNMEWTVNGSFDPDIERAAGDYPLIRHFKVPHVTAAEPQAECPGSWAVCTPDSVGNFTAVGYYFGRDLHRVLDVPIGLVNTSWGGTRSEAWTSREALAAMPEAEAILKQWDAAIAAHEEKPEGKSPALSPHSPSALYNAMLHPLVPYAMRGAIWYQGESNAGRAWQYRTIFPGMISDWRQQWGEDFPFYFVQLANFKAPQTAPGNKDGWTELQEAQLLTLGKLDKVGMAVINDVGNAGDIHPKDKQSVGRRLARWALNRDYGRGEIAVSGPLYKGYQVDGNKVKIDFDHGRGMKAREGGPVLGFEIAGEDKQFVWAQAKVEGESVVVWADGIDAPASVRYAWAANPVTANLVNGAGLPASVFRTDDWEETTRHSFEPGVRP